MDKRKRRMIVFSKEDNGWVTKRVMLGSITREMITSALKANPQFMRWIPVGVLTEEDIIQAAKQDPICLECLPLELFSIELMQRLTEENHKAINHIPTTSKIKV
jgi:hypothetical protein